MTSFALDQKIHIDAPNAESAFALERRLVHFHASAVCVHDRWAVELYDTADSLEEIEGAVRHWLRDTGLDTAVIEVVGGRTVEVVLA